MSTVGELLHNRLSGTTRLVAGEGGLEKPVSWAVTARARTPAIAPLQGGEIVLVPQGALNFLGGEPMLTTLIQGFHDGGAAAVCVWTQPDESALACANELNMPLVHIAEVPATAVERDLIDYITGQIRSRLRQQESRQSDLLDALAANRGLEALIRVLAEHVGHKVAYLPVSGSPLTSSGQVPNVPSQMERRPTKGGDVLTVADPADGGHLWITPVQHRGTHLGLLVVTGSSASPTAGQALSMRQTAAAISVEQGRLDAAAEAEQRLRDNFYKDLFTGRAPDTLHSRARSLGVALPTEGAVAIIAPQHPEERLPDVVKDRVHGLLTRQASYPLLDQGSTLLMLVPTVLRGDNTVNLLLRSLSPLGVRVAVGISEPVQDPRRIPDAVDEANTALLVGRRTKNGAPTRFSDTGAYGLLAPLRETPAVARIVEQLLGQLIAYDQQHNAALASTLETYINLNGNASTTAHQLSLHRNSLSYRLRRIEELTGLTLSNAENRLLLTLALRLKKLQ